MEPTLLLRAKQVLSRYVEQAGLEVPVMASFSTQNDLRSIHKWIERRLDDVEQYPNRSFHGLAEAAARCLVLYEVSPDKYADLVRGICGDELEMFLDSYEGLLRFLNLLNGLSDDHSYIFNHATLTIEVQRPETCHENGLTPASLLMLVLDLERTI